MTKTASKLVVRPSRFRDSKIWRQATKLRYTVLLWGVENLIKYGRHTTARKVIRWITDRSAEANPRLASLASRAWGTRESYGRITELRFIHLNRLLVRPLKEKDHLRLLQLAARYEALGKSWKLEAGDLIARQLVSENGRRRIRDASAKALKTAPESTFLIYLNAVTTAKCGDPTAAGKMLSDHIARLVQAPNQDAPRSARIKRQFAVLRAAWRVVDLIAREEMLWLDDQKGKGYTNFSNAESTAAGGIQPALVFDEPLLQARATESYQRSCRRNFDSAGSLNEKLKAIKDMLREGSRRQLSYHLAYAEAQGCYRLLKPELDLAHEQAVSGKIDGREATQFAQAMSTAVDVCRKMNMDTEARSLDDRLLELSRLPQFSHSRWQLLAAIVDEDDLTRVQASRELRLSIKEPPRTEAELRSFLKWALLTREFEDAELVFKEQVKPSLQASEAALYFVNILQRQSRFGEAQKQVRLIHARMLANPAGLRPYIHWSLVRRYGELSFLRHTSNIFRTIPQPVNPVGVVLLAARNIDQIRKYPLVALMLMKQQGWAIIPLVEGLLPRELTGNPRIDILNGCVSMSNVLVRGADAYLPQVRDFEVDPSKGVVRWGKIDLGHSLLEDARISRRAYNVDLTCPALVNHMRRLCVSTEHFSRAIDYARSLFKEERRRGALLSLFNSRLPDSLFRFYCDEYGSPENFFCLHTTNGYENYFRNFQSSISTRSVIRNVTKYKDVRSASMPIPELFERYYDLHKQDLNAVLERIGDVANIRRTTGGNAITDPQAAECKERILSWRKSGGKVACMFGRVVCDSAVPFDGGPAHKNLSDWVNHTIQAVKGSDTLLLIKPHPHELNEAIGTYLNEYFIDLVTSELPPNVIVLGHRWFDLQSMKELTDIGLVYNSTAAVELALQEIPTVVCGHFASIDYPVGHIVPVDRMHYERLVRFETENPLNPESKARAAIWLQYMSNSGFALDYRYHARPVTNRVVYPPYWIEEDVKHFAKQGDNQAAILADRAIGLASEP